MLYRKLFCGCFFGCLRLFGGEYIRLVFWIIFSIFAEELLLCMSMEDNRYVLGIDPGLSGGLVLLCMGGDVVDVCRMPSTPYDILCCLRGYVSRGHVVCYMEKVGTGMPGQSSKATATFARHNGHLEMALLALGVRTIEVTPSKWMKSFQLGRSSDYCKTEWKNRLKSCAQQLFPRERVTLYVSDALLIAEYGRRCELGSIV